MIVILDTNILRQDFLLRSPKIDILLAFLLKVQGRLIIPDIVYQEIRGLYVREIQRHLKHIDDARCTLHDLLINKDIPPLQLDINAQTKLYLDHLRKRLRLRDSDIVQYKKEYLDDVVHRATNRIHPFTDDRKEFRDVLLWLTALDLCASQPEELVVLISNNTRDFAEKDAQKLHPVLAKEAQGKQANIQYYPSIDYFLRAHSTKYEFITKEWIFENIDIRKLERELQTQLEQRGESLFQRYLERHEENRFYNPNLISVLSFDIVEYYCIDVPDGSIRIEAFFVSECEVEYSIVREKEEEYSDYDWDFDYMKGTWDWQYTTKTRIIPVDETQYTYPFVESNVDIVVRDRKVESVRIIDWDLR